jgi:L-lactate dehydrogenase complex protein LldE
MVSEKSDHVLETEAEVLVGLDMFNEYCRQFILPWKTREGHASAELLAEGVKLAHERSQT